MYVCLYSNSLSINLKRINLIKHHIYLRLKSAITDWPGGEARAGLGPDRPVNTVDGDPRQLPSAIRHMLLRPPLRPLLRSLSLKRAPIRHQSVSRPSSPQADSRRMHLLSRKQQSSSRVKGPSE